MNFKDLKPGDIITVRFAIGIYSNDLDSIQYHQDIEYKFMFLNFSNDSFNNLLNLYCFTYNEVDEFGPSYFQFSGEYKNAEVN